MKPVLAFCMMMIAAPSTAQPVASAPATGCELHVWPAARLQATTTGWASQLGMIGSLADRAGHASGDRARRANLVTALDPKSQLAALQELDLVGLLGLQPAQIIAHPESLDGKAAKTTVRHTPSTSPCYAELIVSGVLYQKTAVHGRALKTGFVFRDFGSAGQQARRSAATGENALTLFPPKDSEEVSGSNAELVSVFQRNFVEAAANFVVQRLMGKR